MARDVASNRPDCMNSDTDISDTESINSSSERMLPETNAKPANNVKTHKCGNLPTINEGKICFF